MTTQQHRGIPVPQVEPRQEIPTQNLRIPGPTSIPLEVQTAQAAQMINHRGPEFSAIAKRVTTRLQYFYQTEQPVLTVTASGTAGQESAIVNLFSPGDHVISITIGAFGNRFAQIAEAYGVQVSRITFPWGQAADPTTVEAKLQELPAYRGVLITHNETSTGVTNDLQALAAVIRRNNPDALIAVDAVSSLGCVPLEMDAWDLDVVYTGSQKGWMSPPGIMMIAASARAWEANKSARLPRFYLDWEQYRKILLEKWQHPSTPAVSIFYALDTGLEMMINEGRTAIFERHAQAGDYVRTRAKTFGLELLADHAYASNTVTAIKVPEGIDGKALLKALREQDHVVLGEGQGALSGKIVRIGHMGYFTQTDLELTMDALERRLQAAGFKN